MKTLQPLSLVALLLACGAPPTEETMVRGKAASPSSPADGGVTDAAAWVADGEVSSPPAVLADRVDLDLELGARTLIPGWDVVATVIDARRASMTSPSGKRGCTDVAVVRFERGDDEPVELHFGPPHKNAYPLYGHSVAVWGATTLTVYPPGVRARP